MLSKNRIIQLALATLAVGGVAQAQEDKDAKGSDWAQWRGSKRDGVSPETAWAKAWPKVAIKPKWSAQVGKGYAAVSILKDRAYTAGYSDKKDTVLCLDAKSGKVLWSFQYACAIYDNMNEGGPAGTPSVDGDQVFTVSREAHVHALDAKSGKEIWKKDLKSTDGAKVPTWGFSGSPLVDGEQVIIDVGTIVAFDRKSGERVWKTENYGSAYSSPVLFEREGKKYLAVFPAQGLIILERETGKPVVSTAWKTNYDVNAATPIIEGNEFFISSGYGVGCALFRWEGDALVEGWRNRNMKNHMASCVRYQGHFYGFDESLLKCLDAKTGEVIWSERGLGKGCLIMAAGKLIVLSERGELFLAEASAKGFEAPVKKKVLNAGGCWSAPVLAQGRIYCRAPSGELVCVEVK